MALAAVACLACFVASSAHADELRVVATIKPVHALVASVMQGAGTPELLVTGTSSPHTFALKPSGARALNAAAVVFRVSATVEPFTVKVAEALPPSVRLITLADAPGVHRLPVRRGSTFEAHDHDHDHGAHADEPTDTYDGHVWLNPENAKAMVQEIARALGDAAPQSAALFKANAGRMISDIDALDRDIASTLEPVRSKPYVVFHDAYQYFESRYGLSPVAALTLGPDIQPGAKRISEIRAKIAEVGAVCVFAEPQFSAKVMRAVTDGTQAEFGTLDPEGALVEPGPSAYATLMRSLSTNLRDCLVREAQNNAGN